MSKKMFLSAFMVGMLVFGIVGACLGGVEPSPFEPEINQLHSIELQVAAINKRVAKLDESDTLPEGATNYLDAMANQMQGLTVRLEEVLTVLRAPTEGGTYIGQDEVVFALDSIRLDSKTVYDIVGKIAWRMGVEPSPFLPLFNDVSRRIIIGINDHFSLIGLPSLPPPLPLP